MNKFYLLCLLQFILFNASININATEFESSFDNNPQQVLLKLDSDVSNIDTMINGYFNKKIQAPNQNYLNSLAYNYSVKESPVLSYSQVMTQLAQNDLQNSNTNNVSQKSDPVTPENKTNQRIIKYAFITVGVLSTTAAVALLIALLVPKK